jgi:hypothetical protein
VLCVQCNVCQNDFVSPYKYCRCAKLVNVIGVEYGDGRCIGHVDEENPPGIASSVQRMIDWAKDIRQTE